MEEKYMHDTWYCMFIEHQKNKLQIIHVELEENKINDRVKQQHGDRDTS